MKKETKKYLKYRRKSKELTKDMLRNITKLSDFDESVTEKVEVENE